MSRNTPVTKKPYCKVCFDAGKPESEYASHWVRSLPDRNGKSTVTCPTLLNTECRYCYQSGHTAKFCPAIKKNEKERERAKKVEAAEKTKPKVQEKKNASAFAGLMDESDSEEEEKVSKPVEKFPDLCVPAKNIEVELPKPKQEVKSGWAAIAAKPAPPMLKLVRNETIKSKNVILSDLINIEAKIEAKTEAKAAPWAKKQPVVTKSWADESDSEDDECELEEPNWERENDEYDPYKPYAFGVAEDETW